MLTWTFYLLQERPDKAGRGWGGSGEQVVQARLHPPTCALGRESWACSGPGLTAWARSVLTLDVDGDRGLLPSRDGFVGGPAHDALPILHIPRGDEEGAHNALTLAIAKQGLGGQERRPRVTRLGLPRWLG